MFKSLNDIEASFSVIASNIKDYYEGNKHAYRPIAVELRKLLCDTNKNKDISLLKRLFPDFRLRPLYGSQNKIDKHTVFYVPGLVYSDGKGFSKIQELINEDAPSLSIDDWLKQKLIDATTTVRDFIRSVADKEGAHSDREYNEILKKTKIVKISTDWAFCDQFIIVIGRYIIKTLAILMLNKDITQVSEYINEQCAKLGRGGAVLDLLTFATKVTEGVPLDYKDKANFGAMFKDGPERQKAIGLIDSYQLNDVFLLLIKDINDEIWLYQQKQLKDGDVP
jgi:hypothetical protein